MWQNLLTIAIVLLAAGYLVRRLLRRLRGRCGCSCACCPADQRAGSAPAAGRGPPAAPRCPPPA